MDDEIFAGFLALAITIALGYWVWFHFIPELTKGILLVIDGR